MNTKIQLIRRLNKPIVLALCGLALAACSPAEEAAIDASPSAPDLASALFLDQAPSGALTVIEGRSQLSPGDEAVVQGQIGGVLEPFLTGYAGFVLGDTEIVFCNEMGDEGHCPTPWDACCEDKDQLKERRISVQFVDASGHPIEGDLKSATSLKELDNVVVVGTVAETSTPDNMIIYAQKLAVVN